MGDTPDPGDRALHRWTVREVACFLLEPGSYPLGSRREKASFSMYGRLLVKEYSDWFCLDFSKLLHLSLFINKYGATNVPIWQRTERVIKMK